MFAQPGETVRNSFRPARRTVTSRRRLAIAVTLAAGWMLASIPLAYGFGAVGLVQKGTEASGSGTTITASLSSPSTAGDLLVATIVDLNSGCHTDSFSAPAGWIKAADSCRGGAGPVEIWYDANAPAGITSVQFDTGSNGGNTRAQLSEYSGADPTSPLDQTGTANSNKPSTSLGVTTSSTLTAPGDLAVTAFATNAGLSTFTPGSGWTSLTNDPSSGFASDYLLGPTRGATLGETIASSPQTAFGAVIATFAPPCTRGSLSLTVPAAMAFPTVTLTGADLSATSAPVLTIGDMTGNAAGWNITGTSTTFTNAAGKTLPTSAISLASATSAAATGNCTLPTNSVGYPLALPAAATAPTAVKLYDAAANTGAGPVSLTLGFVLTIPANARSGTYTSTWTISVVAGP